MKKLKVTWIDGNWSDDNKAIATTLIPTDASIRFPGGGPIVFRDPEDQETLLIVSQDRLISAVMVDVPDA